MITGAQTCRWCGAGTAAKFSLLHTGARDSRMARTFRCRKCGFCFTETEQADGSLTYSEIYLDGRFSCEARGAAIPDNMKIKHSEAQAMLRFHRLRAIGSDRLGRRGSVLEIGCGLGSFLALMAASGWRTRGIEPDPEYSRIGHELYGTQIDRALLEGAGVADGEFDLVASFHVLEHVADPRGFLGRVHRALVPDGHLYLEVRTLDHPAAGNLDHFLWTRHPNVFWRAFLERVLPQEGFTREASGFSHGNYWGVFRKAPPCLQSPTEPSRPPIWRARALALPSTLARKFGAGRLWSGFYLAASGQLTRDEIVRIRQRGVQLLRNSASNMLSAANTKNRVAHFGLQFGSNAGDILLSDAIRRLLNDAVGGSWVRRHLHATVTNRTIDWINRCTRGVVVGGGGLFLADTNPNKISGWQWPIDARHLHGIKVPLSVFAVGYNKFRGQDRLSPQFEDSLCALVEKSVFVGIRNRGSIRELSSYLPQTLRDKLVLQPCPTTVLSYFWDHSASEHAPERAGRPVLALNIAFDRYGRRFGAELGEVMRGIARMAQAASEDGWSVVVARHTVEDRALLAFLDLAGVRYSVRDLCYGNSEEIVSFYRSVDLAVGMRGHAQMIPFGLGVPIISLVAHDKLAWFLEDIGHPEWGVDVSNREFPEILMAAYRSAAEELAVRRMAIAAAREALWQIARQNLAILAMGYKRS